MAPKLLDSVRETIRLKHLSIRTEEAYHHWIKEFVLFHNKKHPKEMGKMKSVPIFLTLLSINVYLLQHKIKRSMQ